MLGQMNNVTSISQDHENDLISRQAAIDAFDLPIYNIKGRENAERVIEYLKAVIQRIKDLPSAQPELTENWWKTDHGYMWLCPHCGLPVHSDFEECLRCGIKRPSAQHERKKGKWIEDAETFYKAVNEKGGGVDADTPFFVDDIACSECLTFFSTIDNCTEGFDFCPACGADMRGEEDDS